MDRLYDILLLLAMFICIVTFNRFSLTEDTIFIVLSGLGVTFSALMLLFHNKKYLVKHKYAKSKNNSLIYSFNTFEDFCTFCNFLSTIKHFVLNRLFKNSFLFWYNNTYYLQIEQPNFSNNFYYSFSSLLLEFSTTVNDKYNFDAKLKEHGKIIFRKNALQHGIKYFSNN